MKPFFNAFWNTLSDEVERVKKKNSSVVLVESKKDQIYKEFEVEYECIKDKYMSKETECLDRHKVIAILIYLILKHDVVSYEGDLQPNEIFLGKELIASSVAFSVMFDKLRDKLEQKGIVVDFDAYYMPIAMSCKTKYPLIFARNLRYCSENGGINVLELSDKLFLLETITLVKNNIDPRIIAEYESDED